METSRVFVTLQEVSTCPLYLPNGYVLRPVKAGPRSRRESDPKGRRRRGRDRIPGKLRAREGSCDGRNGKPDAKNADGKRGASGAVIPWVQ